MNALEVIAKRNSEVIHLSVFPGFLEETTPECPVLPKDGKLMFKAAEAVTSRTSREE